MTVDTDTVLRVIRKRIDAEAKLSKRLIFDKRRPRTLKSATARGVLNVLSVAKRARSRFDQTSMHREPAVSST